MAYIIPVKTNYDRGSIFPYLPESGNLKTGRQVVFDLYKESDIQELYIIFKQILEEGQTYPQESVESIEEFSKYYLSHETFVVRDETSNEVLGGFYVKPNYPGRSGHICNAGFIVKDSIRGQGLATFMIPKFKRVARDLGYEASVFNLVYVTNIASIKLWENYGFQQIGRVPRAGNLKGLGYVDAIIYYYDLTVD